MLKILKVLKVPVKNSSSYKCTKSARAEFVHISTEEIDNYCQNDTYNYRANNRKIKSNIVFLDKNIPGKHGYLEFGKNIQKYSGDNYYYPEDDK